LKRFNCFVARPALIWHNSCTLVGIVNVMSGEVQFAPIMYEKNTDR